MTQGKSLTQNHIPQANPYGYFDKDQGEYVITRPDTPSPWINYLGKGVYGGIISNTAGGYSFDRDPRADVYQSEPYVYCQNICGPDHPQYGLGRNAWLTGTASWTYVAGVQWILGIRPTFDGLMVSPAIPSEWNGFEEKRIFRGVTYKIKVRRGDPGESSGMSVDGKSIEGKMRVKSSRSLHKEYGKSMSN